MCYLHPRSDFFFFFDQSSVRLQNSGNSKTHKNNSSLITFSSTWMGKHGRPLVQKPRHLESSNAVTHTCLKCLLRVCMWDRTSWLHLCFNPSIICWKQEPVCILRLSPLYLQREPGMDRTGRWSKETFKLGCVVCRWACSSAVSELS